MFLFYFVFIQSPYHFIFPDFKKEDLMTFYVFCSDQKQNNEKKKKKKDRNYNQIFNVKLLVSFFFFFFEPDL